MTNYTETFIQLGGLKKIRKPTHFYQSLFKHRHNSPTQRLILDDVFDDLRGIATFVAPNVKTIVNQTESGEVKVFTPAYAKQKSGLEAWDKKWQTRMAGEEIGGSLSPMQRALLIRGELLRLHETKLENLFEVMCFKAMAGGFLTIRGDQYPTTRVEFGRHPTLTATTLTGRNWTAPNVNPLDIISTMSELSNVHGQAVTDTLIMGRKAWQAFFAYYNTPERHHLLDNSMRGSDLKLNLMQVANVDGVNLMASFTGSNGTYYQVYVDNRIYYDEKGRVHKYVQDGEVIGIDSKMFDGVQAFGAIAHFESELKPYRIFHSEYSEFDPNRRYILSETAPLMIPLSPNASWRIMDVTK